MRWKLDENLDPGAGLLSTEGDDADTVLSEGLSGTTDELLFEECNRAGRTLVTLDLDFSNPLRFPPAASEGIVIVRPPRHTMPAVRITLSSALPELRRRTLTGRLWIVEPGRIRVYDPADSEDDSSPPN
jgi:predicted nuclease of predicted toxin-antitoxin system